MGCISAATRGSALDFVLRIGTYVAWAVPVFVVAIVLQEGFGRVAGGWGLGWFPPAGWAGSCPSGQGIDPHNFQCPAAGHGLTHVGQVIYHLALPALALALGFVGVNARYLRNALIDTLDAPFITVARGKGLTERAVLLRHGLRNAFVAFVPALVSDLGLIFGGALVVDYIFKLGGMGTLFLTLLPFNVDGILQVDTYALMLLLLLGAAVMLATSLLSEVARRAARPAHEVRLRWRAGRSRDGGDAPGAAPAGAGRTWRRLLRQPVAVGAGVVLASSSWSARSRRELRPTPRTIAPGGRGVNHAPMLSGWHLLGTDDLGRDMLVRTLYGLHIERAVGPRWRRCSRRARRRRARRHRGLPRRLGRPLIMRLVDLFGVFPA